MQNYSSLLRWHTLFKASYRSMSYCILDQLDIQGEGHELELLHPCLHYFQIVTFTFFLKEGERKYK